jgi:basic membrane protein A
MSFASQVESGIRQLTQTARIRKPSVARNDEEMKMSQWPKWAVSVALLAIAGAWLSPVVAADAPLKVGFIYVGPIGDAGWTFQHDSGRREMEKALAGKVTSQYVESVPEGVDAERVIGELARSGNKIIFTTSFG